MADEKAKIVTDATGPSSGTGGSSTGQGRRRSQGAKGRQRVGL